MPSSPPASLATSRSRSILRQAAVLAVALAGSGGLFAANAQADALGAVTELSAGITGVSHPSGIAAGPDGNVWFTEYGTNRVARVTPAGAVTEFPLPGDASGNRPSGITAGPDGNLWVAAYGGNAIVRVTPSGAATEFRAGLTANSGPSGIATGSDGNLWFTEYNGSRIGRITTSGVITEFKTGITGSSKPLGIAAGPDSALWFTEYRGSKIGRITTSGVVTEYKVGTNGLAGPAGITAGPDGNLWFTQDTANKVARITPAGTITEFGGLAPSSRPLGITAAPDGNLWVAEYLGDAIARVTTAGAVTEFKTGISFGSGATSVVAGADKNLWFTEFDGDRMGRLGLGLDAAGAPTPGGGNPTGGSTTKPILSPSTNTSGSGAATGSTPLTSKAASKITVYTCGRRLGGGRSSACTGKRVAAPFAFPVDSDFAGKVTSGKRTYAVRFRRFSSGRLQMYATGGRASLPKGKFTLKNKGGVAQRLAVK